MIFALRFDEKLIPLVGDSPVLRHLLTCHSQLSLSYNSEEKENTVEDTCSLKRKYYFVQIAYYSLYDIC